MKEEENNNEFLIDKDKLLKHIDEFNPVRLFYCNELKNLFGYEKPYMKVKGASLNDHILANSLGSNILTSLETILKRIDDGDNVNMDFLISQIKNGSLHNNTLFEINLFKQCVVEPEFTYQEVLKISEVYPGLVNKVSAFALGITTH